jgi:hypothetical protein
MIAQQQPNNGMQAMGLGPVGFQGDVLLHVERKEGSQPTAQ